MKIRDFTKPELDKLRELCNFTEDEKQVFELKATDHSNVQIALILCISESQVSKLAKRIKSKIMRVI